MNIFIHFLATFLILFMVGAAFYIFKKRVYYYFLLCMAGYGLTKIIETVIKALYYIPRPYIAMHKIPLVSFAPTDGSFPSGHTSSAFMLATLVFLYNKKLGIIFYILAVLVGVGRVLALVHYPVDILGGAILGIICGFIVFKLANRIIPFREK